MGQSLVNDAKRSAEDTPDGFFSKIFTGDMVAPISTPFMHKKVI
jgi:hypothetical protein